MWNYNPNEYEEKDFSILPEGDYRVRIAEVVEKTFRSGNSGFEITLDVSGRASKLWYYLVLNPADTKATNQRIGQFLECFGLPNAAWSNPNGWVGKVGGARVKHDEWNGETSAKVQYLLRRSKQEDLPGWIEPKSATKKPDVAVPDNSEFRPISADADLPF